MSNAFESAHAFTAQWEGGLTDHPADPGGLTNYGVSLRWVQDLAQQARQKCLRQHKNCESCPQAKTLSCTCADIDLDMDDVDADDIRACTRAQAAHLFKNARDALSCATLPLPLADFALYDGAVNMGPGRAVRQLQQGMNAVGSQLDHYTSIAEDGAVRPAHSRAAEALEAANLHWFAARQILRLRDAFYRDLAARRPSLKVFLEGWRNRVKAAWAASGRA